MKKFLKLALAVAALATMFGFASCSNDSSNDSTAATTASVAELNYTDAELAGKKFSYDDSGTKYLIFTGGNCYESSTENFTIGEGTKKNSTIIVKCNGKLYKAALKYTRASGTGLYTTWNPNQGSISFTFNADGTGTAGGNNSFTFTNNAGVLTMTADKTYTCYYDGSYIYFDLKELTSLGDYSAA